VSAVHLKHALRRSVRVVGGTVCGAAFAGSCGGGGSPTGTAAFAGMLTGLGIAVVWGGYLVVSGRPELTPVAASVAMVVPFFVIPVVSMCSTPPSSVLLRDAFAEDSFIE